jgi:hypothetical protein
MADGVYVTSVYVPNIPAIKVAGDAAGAIGVRKLVEMAVEEAKSIAPVDTGTYRDSIRGTFDGVHGQVGSDLRYAVYLEFGTSDTPIFATLRRAVEAVTL